jgi:hypothetical protein
MPEKATQVQEGLGFYALVLCINAESWELYAITKKKTAEM